MSSPTPFQVPQLWIYDQTNTKLNFMTLIFPLILNWYLNFMIRANKQSENFNKNDIYDAEKHSKTQISKCGILG